MQQAASNLTHWFDSRLDPYQAAYTMPKQLGMKQVRQTSYRLGELFLQPYRVTAHHQKDREVPITEDDWTITLSTSHRGDEENHIVPVYLHTSHKFTQRHHDCMYSASWCRISHQCHGCLQTLPTEAFVKMPSRHKF